VKFQIGDTIRVGTRVGTIIDIGTVLIQFKTNDGCLRNPYAATSGQRDFRPRVSTSRS
jgi:hypothetical protein